MPDMTFKTFGELDISKSLTDEANVVIEENGDVKRFPANSIGKVKTVNGVEPDESGNVAVDVPEGFSGSWNDLSDKPFGINLGRVLFSEQRVSNYSNISSDVFIPIVSNTKYELNFDGTVHTVVATNYAGGQVEIKTNGCVYVIQNKAQNYWFMTTSGSDSSAHTLSLKEADIIKPLEEGYIPDTIARAADIPGDDHINSLIDAKLEVIENGTY